MRLTVRNANVDLTTIFNKKFAEFEELDLTGTGNNRLKFDRLDILELSDMPN